MLTPFISLAAKRLELQAAEAWFERMVLEGISS